MGKCAVFVLNRNGLETARRLKTLLGDVEILGLEPRVPEADQGFEDFAATLRQQFQDGRTIIGLCAAGILIRPLASLLSDKRSEPPVLALSDDGKTAVPLLGGLTGANELAREIAAHFGGDAAITASGARRFGLQLETPPPGYVLANPEAAKSITSALLAGRTARLEGAAPWLSESGISFEASGDIPLKVTTESCDPPAGGLLFHPKTILAVVRDPAALDIRQVQDRLDTAGLARLSLAAIIVPSGMDVPAAFRSDLQDMDAELRCHDDLDGLLASTDMVDDTPALTLLRAPEPVDLTSIGRPLGRLTVLGLGPGAPEMLTPDARSALEEADDLVGYATYLDLVPKLAGAPRRHASGNRVELDRACEALDLAVTGRKVVIVSSGDPGIFAMAAAVMEALEAEPDAWPGLEIEIVPGISAMQLAAARLGAPLGHDFAVISLSDIRKPWEVIERRLRAAATGDFVIAIYNPASRSRRQQIETARDILTETRSPETPVVVGRDLGRPGEHSEVIALGDLGRETVDMRTILIIGSSRSRVFEGPGGRRFVYAPRSHEDP